MNLEEQEWVLLALGVIVVVLALRVWWLERRVTALETKSDHQALTLKEIEAMASIDLLRLKQEREEFEAEVLSDLEHLAPGEGGATLGS
jgi:hypothetical protein